MSEEPERYNGFRVSFGVDHPPNSFRYMRGYKANFKAPIGSYGDVIIPFNEFTDNWDPATGDAKVKCVDDSQFCPTLTALKDLQRLEIMGESVAGKILLKIKSISGSWV